MQFDIMRSLLAHHVESRFHCGPRCSREAPAKRSVKYKLKVKINRIERRHVRESVQRFTISLFYGVNERDNVVDRGFIQNAARLPKDKRQIFAEENASRKLHITSA